MLILVPIAANGASWYFDNAASGANDGTSWADAWESNGDVDWTGSGIQPGDTLYVSGGSATKTYSENLYVTNNGTAGNYITVKIGQDANHNGVAVFDGYIITADNNTPQYLKIDGGRDASFVAPTNHRQVITGATAITNNIGFRFINKIGTTASDTDPVGWYFTKGVGNFQASWIEFSGYTNTNPSRPWSGTCIYASIDPPQDQTNLVFEYMYFYGNSGQQVSWNGQTASDFGEVEFRYCYMYSCAEDHFEVGSGVTVRDSVIGPAFDDHGVHCDFFQLTGNYIKIYNNLIRESYNSIMRIQSQKSSDGLVPFTRHNNWFFNNTYSEIPGRSQHGGILVEPIALVHFDSLNPTDLTIWSNIVIANNTFWGTVTNTAVTPEIVRNPLIYFSRGPQVTNSYWTNSMFVNNIIFDRAKGASLPATTNLDSSGGAWTYTTNDLFADYNTIAATNLNLPNPWDFVYLDENIGVDPAATYRFSTTTNQPSWVDPNNEDFDLSDNDTVAINTGYDMSSYFDFDALNRARNAGGSWDRGAFENQAADGLVVFLSFDNDTDGTAAQDDSGNGYDGVKFLLSGGEDQYPTNRAVADIGGTTFRPNATGNAVDFLWNTNSSGFNPPLYYRDGAFYGVTNAQAALSNMNAFTVMCWARYQDQQRTDYNGTNDNYTQDSNISLISGGSTANADSGSWFLGRYNQDIWINNTRFVLQTNDNSTAGSWGNGEGDPTFGDAGKVVWNYPDYGFNNDGDTTNWYHYAFTFTNGVGTAYFNGVPVGTNDVSANLTTLNLGSAASRPYDWVGIGVNTHIGTPEFDDETPGDSGQNDYPNNGFMNGGIDQVRIYSRALSWQDVIDVANSEGAEFSDAGSGGGSPTYSPTRAARTFGRGRGRF